MADGSARGGSLTFATGRDICFTYRFTRDEKRIVYLREPEHGSELLSPFVLHRRFKRQR